MSEEEGKPDLGYAINRLVSCALTPALVGVSPLLVVEPAVLSTVGTQAQHVVYAAASQ